MTGHSTTLMAAAWPVAGRNALLRNAAVVILGSLLLIASAKVDVPFWPVPVSMQTFAVFLIGLTLGWRLATATVLVYLGQGLAGLPVFAYPGAGPAYFAISPTTGYLIGFLLAAAVIGWLAERGWDRSVVTAFAAVLVGNVAIYVPGVTWLWAAGHAPTWEAAIAGGVVPFLAGDALKMALAAVLVVAGWRRLDRSKAKT